MSAATPAPSPAPAPAPTPAPAPAAATPAPAAAVAPKPAAGPGPSAAPATSKDAKTPAPAAAGKDGKTSADPNDIREAKKSLLATQDKDEDWDATADSYSAAPRMSVVDIMNKDKGDKSLEKYKAALLGEAAQTKESIAYAPNDTRHCIVDTITLVFSGRPPFVINPSDKNLKAKSIILKEGQSFKTIIKFYIQHEIVSGLRYQNAIYKHRFRVDKRKDMLGSFAPQKKAYEITMPEDCTPTGWSGRGSYSAKCKIVDDDKTVHCQFEYAFEIKTDWK